jgi:hypothetical protein
MPYDSPCAHLVARHPEDTALLEFLGKWDNVEVKEADLPVKMKDKNQEKGETPSVVNFLHLSHLHAHF